MTSSVFQGERPRLLLIDDDHGVRKTLARLLATDFDVTQEADGQAGIARLAVEQFDVVLTDLEMPHASGDEVFAWVESNQPTLASRFIVLSGGARDLRKSQWLEAFDRRRVLQKPCGIDAVIASIRYALSGGGT